MNTERLFNIVKQLQQEVRIQLPMLEQLVSQLQQATNSPNEQNQRNVENTRQGLVNKLLEQAQSNQFSPGIFDDMSSLTVNGVPVNSLVGSGLANALNEMFAGGYTSVQTLDRARKMLESVQSLSNALQQTNVGLAGLGVTDETLAPGQSIVAMSMPRDEIKDASELQREIQFLGRFLSNLGEVLTGSGASPMVYSLHSSWWGIELLTPIQVAALTATLIGGIKNTLDLLQKFRSLKEDAEDVGLDEEIIEKIAEKGKRQAEEKLESLTAEIFTHAQMDEKGRLNELKTSIRFDLNALTNKIEQGFAFDVRTRLPKDASEDLRTQASAITTFQFRPISGPRLIELPEKAESHDDSLPKKKAAKKATEKKSE